ncbi:hypothetical protein H5410_059924 [Solanum commersonii]|uniref:Uncharacterized protein n=1 Tax=Solanum commersonii TaxID=4109 RepID=A0A9J5W4Z0_SOLCO|nr:hypothetical protein H5410_059924 [Solanum commersonii]
MAQICIPPLNLSSKCSASNQKDHNGTYNHPELDPPRSSTMTNTVPSQSQNSTQFSSRAKGYQLGNQNSARENPQF